MPVEEVVVNPSAEFLASHMFSSISTDEEGNLFAKLAPHPATLEQLRVLRRRVEAQLRTMKDEVELILRRSSGQFLEANMVIANERLHEQNAALTVERNAARTLCVWYRKWLAFETGQSTVHPGEYPQQALIDSGTWNPWDTKEERDSDNTPTQGTIFQPDPVQSQIMATELNGV